MDTKMVVFKLDTLARYLERYDPLFFDVAVNKTAFAEALRNAIAIIKEGQHERTQDPG